MKLHRASSLSILFLICFGLGLSAQTTIEEHWSPYDYPRTIDEGVKYHIIVKGDTLWDIAGHYFDNPLLWPQLYQANPYIQDPDLIYPGDPVILEIGVVISDSTVAGQVGDEPLDDQPFSELNEFTEGEGEDDDDLVSDRTQTTSLLGGSGELIIIPAGDRTDLECSTYIIPMKTKKDKTLTYDMRIVGAEEPTKISFGIDDVVYIDKGERDGLSAGEMFSIRHELDLVYSEPEGRGELLGRAVDQVGKLRVIAVQEKGSTAIITDACGRITKEDFLVPYEQEPIPLITELPPFDRWEKFETEGSGAIVYSEDNTYHIGIGGVVNANLGIINNVAPGDILIVYRPNPHNNPKDDLILPDIYLGQAVAIKTSDETSILKIIEGVDVMRVGDKVVPYQ